MGRRPVRVVCAVATTTGAVAAGVPMGVPWRPPRERAAAGGAMTALLDFVSGHQPWWFETGDSLASLRQLPANIVACAVTSPPYWCQRIYNEDPEQIGQELTPEAWVERLAEVFFEVRRVVATDGSFWLNVGDKFAAGGLGGGGMASSRANWKGTMGRKGWRKPPAGYKKKDLTLAPFMLAAQLRQDGWYLRQTIVWEKAAAVEPPRLDRPSTSHEYLFLFTKTPNSTVRDPGEPWWLKTVWCICADGDGSHPAQMPTELARRCIMASTRPGDLVLDPFSGFGTTILAANRIGRRGLGLELNPEYVEAARRRICDDSPMFHDLPIEVPA